MKCVLWTQNNNSIGGCVCHMINEIRRYRPDDESALLELESHCTLGTRLSIRIIRPLFSLRSTLFPESQIFVSTQNGTIVGTTSVALKDVRVGSRHVRIGYLFDARVHPDHRRSHVASELMKWSLSYLESKGAEAAYVRQSDHKYRW